MTDDEFIDARIEEYIEKGLLIYKGVDDSGERIFTVSPRAETEAPELHRVFIAQMEDEIIELYQMGLVEITFSDSGEPLYSLSEAGIKLAEETVAQNNL